MKLTSLEGGDIMGRVIDFQIAHGARQDGKATPDDYAWADQVAALWYSPAVRLIAAAGVFAVVITGLGLAVFGIACLLGALG